ncbi:PKD domain-containing protein, partial [candidate division KSB1 bacterium]|nr:PKD domain-containing protein [candidate division KSB1 bacterium]
HDYEEGTVVDISAAPATGYQFVNWTGGVADANNASTTVTMNGNKTVTANFSLIPPEGSVVSSVIPSNSNPEVGDQITVDIKIDMSGVQSPNDKLGSFTGSLDWNSAVLAYNSNSGPQAGFTGAVNPSSGHIAFNGANAAGASGNITVLQITFDVVGAGSSVLDLGYSAMAAATTFNNLLPYLVVNDGSVSVNPPIYTLTMAVSPAGTGTTSPAIGDHSYQDGTVVDISATPSSDYQFASWSGDVADANSASTTVTVHGNTTVTANFVLANPSGSAVSSAIPSNSSPDIGDQITVDIKIDMSGVNSPNSNLGSFSGALDWNPAVLTYSSHSGPLAGFTGAVNPSSGHIAFNGANAGGASGDITVLQITFDVVGVGVCPLDLGYSAMAAAGSFYDLLPILTVNDGNVEVCIPIAGVNPASLSFDACMGSGNPASQSVSISNTGCGAMDWTIADDADWLSFSSNSGSVSAGSSASVDVEVDIAGLSTGNYTGTITVSSNAYNGDQTVSVTLTVNQPQLSVSPASLQFESLQDGDNPANQQFTISNPGCGSLLWSVSDNADWLSVDPASGSTASQQSSGVNVIVNIAGLLEGIHTATITVEDDNQLSPAQTIDVVLDLGPATIEADFSADPSEGNAPLYVQFSDLSTGKITEWHWDFGDGSSSDEQNPSHTFNPEISRSYTVVLTVTGPAGQDMAEKSIDVIIPIRPDFDAGPTVGFGPLTVKFENLTEGATNPQYYWDFGDGTTSNCENPKHCYVKPGLYEVSLTATTSGARATKRVWGLVEVYNDKKQSGFAGLKVIDGSAPIDKNNGWDKAIDGDIYKWSGVTSTGLGEGWAIFGFQNDQIHTINRIRMYSHIFNGGSYARKLNVYASTTGTEDTDFSLAYVLENGDYWNDHMLDPVDAKYLKIVILEPASWNYQQICEFEVYDAIEKVDVSGSTIAATNPHYANGTDECTVAVYVADADNNPVTGLPSGAIRVASDACGNHYYPAYETNIPGTYAASFTSIVPGDQTITAYVLGEKVEYQDLDIQTPVVVNFIEPDYVKEDLVVVSGSETEPGEGWDNAIDGDIQGSDGIVTPVNYWSKAWVIFKFANQQINNFQKFKMILDPTSGSSSELVSKFDVLVSVTDTEDSNFVLLESLDACTPDWDNHLIWPVSAKYVKLVLRGPLGQTKRFAEFEVYSTPSMLPKSTHHKVSKADLFVQAPKSFNLESNYPNPFNPETTIKYQLASIADVTLKIYNLKGQLVATLVNENQDTGYYAVVWQGINNYGAPVSSGVYVVEFQATDEHAKTHRYTQKMTLMK